MDSETILKEQKTSNSYCTVYFVSDGNNISSEVSAGVLNDGKDSLVFPLNSDKGIFKPGVYLSFFNGREKYCSVNKVFTISEEETDSVKYINIPLVPLQHTKAEGKDCIFLFPDVLETMLYNSKTGVTFNTPGFSKDKTINQFTSNSERIRYLNEIKSEEYMKIFYDIFPVVIFSEELNPDNTLDDVLKELSTSQKLNVLFQAQLHGNEFAAGEGALTIITYLNKNPSILKNINLVILPCINQDGNDNGTRDCNGTNLNRDFLNCTSQEMTKLHDIFFKFLPEVVIDAHTFTRSNVIKSETISKSLFDAKISTVSTNNMDKAIIQLNSDIVNDAITYMNKENYRTGFYNNNTNPDIGRIYYSLLGGCSILFESEGTATGKFHYSRNVACQYKGIRRILGYISTRSEYIKESVRTSRGNIARKRYNCEPYTSIHDYDPDTFQKSYIDDYDFFGNLIEKKYAVYHKIYNQNLETVNPESEISIPISEFSPDQIKCMRNNHISFNQSNKFINIQLNNISGNVAIELLLKWELKDYLVN